MGREAGGKPTFDYFEHKAELESSAEQIKQAVDRVFTGWLETTDDEGSKALIRDIQATWPETVERGLSLGDIEDHANPHLERTFSRAVSTRTTMTNTELAVYNGLLDDARYAYTEVCGTVSPSRLAELRNPQRETLIIPKPFQTGRLANNTFGGITFDNAGMVVYGDDHKSPFDSSLPLTVEQGFDRDGNIVPNDVLAQDGKYFAQSAADKRLSLSKEFIEKHFPTEIKTSLTVEQKRKLFEKNGYNSSSVELYGPMKDGETRLPITIEQFSAACGNIIYTVLRTETVEGKTNMDLHPVNLTHPPAFFDVKGLSDRGVASNRLFVFTSRQDAEDFCRKNK